MISSKYQVLSIKYIKERKRIFLIGTIGIFLILIFLGFKGKMQDFFLFEILKQENSPAQNLEIYYASLKPFRNWGVTPLDISALSAISAEINEAGNKKFLYAENIDKKLAIASLTKLMTAYIALENYDLNQEVIISFSADSTEGNSANLRTGEGFYVKDLIYSLLVESSNEPAQALAEIIGEAQFVYLMNQKAQEWGLENTYFLDAIGLDPDNPSASPNYSTSQDLVSLSWQALKNPIIKEILQTKEFKLYTTNGKFHHLVENNNELLNDSKISWKNHILGAKTGWTPIAGQCLILVLENPRLRQGFGGQARFSGRPPGAGSRLRPICKSPIPNPKSAIR